MSPSRPTVAIVGGGFSGAAVAYHLARANVPASLIVFEPRARIGAGLAYGGDDPVYRVNVPATRMSLEPSDDTHFARWLASSGVLAQDPGALSGVDAFPRRQDFGRYVDQALRPFLAEGRVRHVREAVVSLRLASDGWLVRRPEAARPSPISSLSRRRIPVRLFLMSFAGSATIHASSLTRSPTAR